MAIVTGIFATCDPQAIEDALKAQNVDVSKLKVVTGSAPSDDTEGSIINFVHVAQAQGSNDFSDDMTHGTNVIDGSGGTGVPGIGGAHQDLRDFEAPDSAEDYLGGMGISTDQVGNYNDAIDEGRCVAVFDAGSTDTAPVVTAFHSAGLLNVKTY